MKDNFIISQDAITKILQKHHLDSLSTFEEIKTGLINPVFIINKRYVLRVNTTENKQNFEKEAFLYDVLPKFDIPTPKCIAYDSSGKIINESYIIFSYIEGEPLTEAFKKANSEVKNNLAFQLGEMAAKIHSVDSKELAIKNDLFGSNGNWKKTIEREFEACLDLAKQKQLLSKKTIKDIEKISKKFASLGTLSEKMCLIHGDYSASNIQAKDGQIVGIFDFEMAKLGDPFYDLQKLPIHFQLGNEFDTSAFLTGYGQKEMSRDVKTRFKKYCLLQGLWELWATETQEFPFGEKEIEEGKDLIAKTLLMA